MMVSTISQEAHGWDEREQVRWIERNYAIHNIQKAARNENEVVYSAGPMEYLDAG